MRDKQKDYDQTRSPLPGRPLSSREKAGKQKTRIELEEHEDLEVNQGSEATNGNPKSPFNTGAIRKKATQESEFDDAGGGDEADPGAIDEEMRNQDS